MNKAINNRTSGEKIISILYKLQLCVNLLRNLRVHKIVMCYEIFVKYGKDNIILMFTIKYYINLKLLKLNVN